MENEPYPYCPDNLSTLWISQQLKKKTNVSLSAIKQFILTKTVVKNNIIKKTMLFSTQKFKKHSAPK